MAPGAGAGPGAGARVRRRGPAPGPPVGQSARGDASFAAGAGPPQAPMLGQAACRAGGSQSRSGSQGLRHGASSRARLGAGTPRSLPFSLPPSCVQGRGARLGSRRPAPAGNNGRGEKRCLGRGAGRTAPERRAHSRRASRACVPRAGGLSVCPAAPALWSATLELSSPPLAEASRPVPGLPPQPSGAQRPAGLTSAAASPRAPSGSAQLPRPGIFMKPRHLAGCHRSGSRSRACLPGLLKGAATRAGGREDGQGALPVRGEGTPSPDLRDWGERRS